MKNEIKGGKEGNIQIFICKPHIYTRGLHYMCHILIYTHPLPTTIRKLRQDSYSLCTRPIRLWVGGGGVVQTLSSFVSYGQSIVLNEAVTLLL